MRAAAVGAGSLLAAVAVLLPAAAQGALARTPFTASLNLVQTLASTVPKNGDVNPYGIAVVPASKGDLTAGDVLVSNFNAKSNRQGTGTTIVEISPGGKVKLFARLAPASPAGACPGGVGLTTALVALRSGYVVAGSLPSANGHSATMHAGCLLILDSVGHLVTTIAGSPINGPWDMTALDRGSSALLFVTNVLNGTVASSPNTVDQGTVVRLDLSTPAGGTPSVESETIIGTGFPERTDPGALVVGPTGVAIGSQGTLYVANSAANRITAISGAVARTSPSRGTTLASGGWIDDPLGLAIAPGGDILTTNGADGNLVETTPAGNQVAVKMLDTIPVPPGPNGNGTLFGLILAPRGTGVYFVDDGGNDLNLLH
ncbi:MAG TPA: hypothetical protein VKX24_03335 [Acidimicrobiia bacterium]|nr:hypothetical protein [Acidimicrobiia bacterium]